jgi:hypothetical protein
MADAYDFQIDSLKFRMATSDKFPYVRGTAPFRKDQFDTSASVGDQSLTGWWTRGQLSFHMGAGLNYYEVLEGEEVFNRFRSSSNVQVFEPGELTLDLDTSSTLPSSSGMEPLHVIALGGGGLAYWNAAGVGYFLSGPTDGTATQYDPPSGGVDGLVNSLASIGGPETFISVDPDNEVQRFNGVSTYTTLYSHSTSISYVWGAKERLWILDSDGKVYVKAAFPSGALPIALSGEVTELTNYVHGNPASLTDAGGSVFLSINTELIYAFTPANDGSVAVLAAPVVAGILPPSELILSIRAHMGLLCIVTTKGVRFAVIDGDNLTIGPHSLEWSDSNCRNIGIQGASVYVTGEDEDNDVIGYEFNLLQPTASNPLVFPCRQAWSLSNATADQPSGAHEFGEGVVWWGGASGPIYSNVGETDLASSGSVTTAYHRFGTLDPKRFYKVVVRASGTGTIQAYQVEADGTETSLGTMNASAGVAEFSVVETDAVERMAFKFVLTRDGSDSTLGPTLLGYQIKALPVPERQRILRVPLVLADSVKLRRGTQVGAEGRAYSDITELETLERDQAIVTFTDHRTGETGTAYIDSVEFQGDTPATHNDNGFGGFAYVTLRVLE